MSKYLTLFCILAMAALFIVPAYAEVQNVKIGGDIAIRGIYRNDYDLQEKAKTDTSVSTADKGDWFMTTTRLRVDADLTDNVSTTIRLLNERDWDEETAATTDVDLDLASITLKELFYSPLSVTLGRQEIVLGDGLILANPYPNPTSIGGTNAIVADDLSSRRAFDAIRAILDYDPWTIDLIAVKLDETNNVTSASVDNDKDLYVANVGYKFGQYNAEAEGYLAFKRDQAKNLTLTANDGGRVTEQRTFEDADIFTLGGRVSLEPTERLTLKGEAAYQFGELQDESIAAGDDIGDSSAKDIDISAWALDVTASYAIDYTWSPKIGVKYAFRSGEKHSWSGDYNQWDPLYEGQVNGVVANALTLGNAGFQLNNTNMNIIGVSGSVVPLEDLTLGVDYYHYILDEKLDSASAGEASSAIYALDDDYGDEIDISLNYAYTPDVSLGLLYGVFMPGDAFADTVGNSYNDNATEVVGTVKVTF